MKPHYERLVHSPEEGFALKEIFGADCSCPWHFHAEYELILVLESQGYRIIGDDVTPLRKGDMVFIGSNLPHLYQHKPPRMSSQCEPRSILLQFDERYWKAILDLPAMTPIRRWLPQASLGLKVSGKTRTAVAEMLLRALEARGPRRIAEFIRILDTLSRSRSNQNIASPSFNATLNPFDEERVNRVYQYINENYCRDITLADAARQVHMSEGAFSRFFRSRFGQTFPAFINRLRVGQACRLLVETDMPVTEVALSSGYTNLSNFNRQFLRLKKTKPRTFRMRLKRPES